DAQQAPVQLGELVRVELAVGGRAAGARTAPGGCEQQRRDSEMDRARGHERQCERVPAHVIAPRSWSAMARRIERRRRRDYARRRARPRPWSDVTATSDVDPTPIRRYAGAGERALPRPGERAAAGHPPREPRSRGAGG